MHIEDINGTIMIEITAKLSRGIVYLSGETIECYITFSNPLSPERKISQSNNDSFESLAWASAQIHCQCSTDPRICTDGKIKENKLQVNSETALTIGGKETGKIEICTHPRILFCDLSLSPGENRTFIYRENLPLDAPPSYLGQLVKYSYKVTIGTQRINHPIRLLLVPLRVLPLPILNQADLVLQCNDTSDELSPANPFLIEKSSEKESPLTLALNELHNVSARRSPNFYLISNKRGKVARFCLFKSTYKLGEDIVGTFDLTSATVHCMQVSVSLQSEEETLVQSKNNSNKQIKHSRIVTYTKFHEVCIGLRFLQLLLPVPLHVTPAFQTPVVTLKWRLHFEFVTSADDQLRLQLPQLNTNDWRAPNDVPIETMIWSLPIRLLATTPTQIVQQQVPQKLYIK